MSPSEAIRRAVARAIPFLVLPMLMQGAVGCGDSPPERAPSASKAVPAAPSPGASPPKRTARPNVVLITLDTARADAFGAYGQARPTSPEIDRMAREGVVFEQVSTASPSTLPSHATILTGRFPIAHGVRSNRGYVLDEDQTTLAEILAGRGYVTAAEIAAPVIGRRTGLDQGFAHYREPGDFGITRKRRVVDADLVEGYDRDGADITQQGLAFLEAQRAASRPFFLWLHYFDPHVDYAAPPEFARGLEDSPYHAEIRYTDHQVGRVLEALRRTGLRDRTLVVLTSDHGEGLGEHQERTHSFHVYDATMRVPLVVWGPDSVPRGRRVTVPVRTADIAPTILDWAGLPVLPGMQGRSLRGLADSSSRSAEPAPGYGESIEHRAVFGSSMLRMWREGPWKYIHKLAPELYHTGRDPGETEDLARAEPARVEAMRAALVDFVEAGAGAASSGQAIDAAQRAQLRALGYVTAGSAAEFHDAEDVREPVGPDPVRVHADLEAYLAGHRRMFESDWDGAVETFRALARRHAGSVAIRDALLEALVGGERWADAMPVAEAVLRDAPLDLRANEALAAALPALGRDEAAEIHLREAASLLPCESAMVSRLSAFLGERGRVAEQIEALEAGHARCPEDPHVQNDLAFLLAAADDPRLLDGPRAVALARAAVASAGGERPDYLDTLACALARVGRYEEAVAALDRAFALMAGREVPPGAAEELEAHRAAFRGRRPVGASASASPAAEGPPAVPPAS